MIQIPEYTNAEKVFFYFEEISKIPHCSGNSDKIADFLVGFAKEHRLYVRRDEANNVIIKKPATAGFESRPTVIIQAHTDMVEAKTPDTKKDMHSEGLDLYRDGDFLRAKGTTLGGDDGIGVAYALALLDSADIPHPAIEAVFTSDEEIGLIGAEALSCEDLSGKLMINIDTDVEGIFTVGCAGGVEAEVSLAMSKKKMTDCGLTLTLDGLTGGHSGSEIDKGRGNAIIIIAKILAALGDIKIAEINGGNAANAIPRSVSATISGISKSEAMSKANAILGEYRLAEPKINLDITEEKEEKSFFDLESSKKLTSLLLSLPNGVMAMSKDVEGLVETSLNLGIIKSDKSSVTLSYCIRSSKDCEREALTERVKSIATEHGAIARTFGAYPGWAYKRDSHLREVMCEVYNKMYGADAKVIMIHAGLECGIFAGKIHGLDCVSIGPDNYDIHTTEERLSISSTARTWEFIKTTLASI